LTLIKDPLSIAIFETEYAILTTDTWIRSFKHLDPVFKP